MNDGFPTPRRGRPRSVAQPAEQPAITGETSGEPVPVPAAQRRRRAKIGELALKLKAPPRPGYVRRFATAKPERVAELEELGYTVVSDASIPSSGLGSGTVQRPAGTGTDGTHYRHILMETPDELYAQGQAELEEHNSKVDEAIRQGRAPETQSGNLPQGVAYGEGKIG